jgi:hypothetical protein
MPAQTPTERPSLKLSLEERYASQQTGGAFNAKNVKEQPIDFGLQDKTFESPSNFSNDNFNPKALNFATSLGHTSTKYKP